MDRNVADGMNFVDLSLSLGSLSYSPVRRDKRTSWSDLVEGLSTTIFPGDVIVEILARLPIEPLIRFLCICKIWYSVIKDKTFHDKHAYFNKKISLLVDFNKKISPLVQRQKLAKEIIPSVSTENVLTRPLFPFDYSPKVSPIGRYMLFQGENFSDQNVIDPPLGSLAPVIIGIINGIVCLVEYNSCVVLWNPATREAYRVPTPSYFPQNEVRTTFGFSLDMETKNDYKIVRYTAPKVYNFYFRTPHVEIYSTRKNSWTVYSQSNPFTWDLFESKCSAILDGIPYWRADEAVEGIACFRDFIAGFSPCSDTFIEIKIPKLKPGLDDYWMVGTVGQSLAIGLERPGVFEILSLDDKGWTKVFSIKTISKTIVNVDNWVPRFNNSVIRSETSRKFFVSKTCSGEITQPCWVLRIHEAFEYSKSLDSPQSSFSLSTMKS